MDLCSRPSLNDVQMKQLKRLAEDKSIDINSTNTHGLTPLLLLCRYHTSPNLHLCLSILLRRKDINLAATNSKGHNALFLLCRFQPLRGDLVRPIRQLLSRGFDSNATDRKGRNCFALICEFYQGDDLVDVGRFLLKSVPSADLDGAYQSLVFLKSRGFKFESDILVQHVQAMRDGRPLELNQVYF